MTANRRILDRHDLPYGKRNNAYLFRDALNRGRWCLYFFNRETDKRHRIVLKDAHGKHPEASLAGLDTAHELAYEKYADLKARTDRGEAIRTLTLAEMVRLYLKREEERISEVPHQGITATRFRLIRNQARHFHEYCSRPGGCSMNKEVHLTRTTLLSEYQNWRIKETNKLDKEGRALPRPGTIRGELSTIYRMFRTVAVMNGFITKEQIPEIPKVERLRNSNRSFRRSALTANEWIELEKCSRLYYIEGKTRYGDDGKRLGFHTITKGENKGKESNRPVTKTNTFGVNKRNKTRPSERALQQLGHRKMLYLAMRISMDSGIRIGSLRQMRWSHIRKNETLSREDQKRYVLIEVPAENTKTGRWYELSAPIARHLESLRTITRPGDDSELLFINLKTRKPLSSRIWADNLKEMLVEAGLAAWSADDSNNCRKIDIHSKKQLTWYSFRHTWITFALERGVPIAVVCNNCDTSLSYVQDHYFHYDASKATSALETGRKFQARSALTTDWMKDPYTDQTP
jgi:integrase